MMMVPVMLWVIAGSAAGTSNTGTVYYRSSGSTNFKSIVYVNSSGDGYYYNAETSTKIFDHSTSHGGLTLTASDIAYGGGKIALRSTTGRVLLYTGNFSNDSWTDIPITQILQTELI